ncbi:Tho complex subunit 7-domain-containing protein [Microdochium trichocladiopsis]|uniref:Tho complex subunit 7-domain-containing protein n=1 Tax=Microdochium trichocladiopsis TaxID=1682393 RepID=A0A9P9BQF1_9PEZI|nr:Tho complex subunit 7-domain-containing protein [Microdochium trichocladiopsis]KAH7034813.1 Tho complex subunit 7-domain-containing protein [Microdochium trichocladiopsis]
MATQHFGLLEERDENELHKTRLLNVEEKPFKRITKRLIGPGAFTNPSALKLPTTPPPEAGPNEGEDPSSTADTNSTVPPAPPAAEIAALKEDIILDFAAFDSAIARLQFLAQANAAERERYAADRLRILATMDSVRENNSQLRVQLDQAKATLAQRKKFDDLADKITSNRMLRTRSEQQVNLAKLAEECEELHRESETYSETWRERREQFGRLVDEGKRLRALIRDEKEEVERREGMDSDAEDGETGEGGSGATPGKTGGSISGNATPRPDSGAVSTPRPSSRGEGTPRPDSPGAGTREAVGGSGLRPVGEESTGATPRAESAEEQTAEGEDVEMGESTQQQTQSQPGDAATPAPAESQSTPQITVDAPAAAEDKMDTT